MLSPITLAVIPSVTPGGNRVALDALCGALAPILGRQVIGAQPDSYSTLTSELEKDRVQYAWMPPVLLVLSHERVQLQPLLTAIRDDRVDFCSVLFVDASRPTRSIDELRGKTVAWVDPASAAGYLCPRMHLSARGVDPAQLFGEELFLGSHADVVRAVFAGRADVGATYAQRPPDGQPVRRAGFCDVAPEVPARVLEWTAPIPNDMIAGHGLIPWGEHRAFRDAILALTARDDGRRLLHAVFQSEQFTPTPPEALRPLWDLVAAARAYGLFHQL